MQAQHHRVCSLSEGITFFVVSEQKDGDSADNSAASSYGLMRSGAVTGTHFSRAPFTAPDLAFLRHLLGSDEGATVEWVFTAVLVHVRPVIRAPPVGHTHARLRDTSSYAGFGGRK